VYLTVDEDLAEPLEDFIEKMSRKDEWGILKHGDINRVCRELSAAQIERYIDILSKALNNVLGDSLLFLTCKILNMDFAFTEHLESREILLVFFVV